jgi:hypothetical protein
LGNVFLNEAEIIYGNRGLWGTGTTPGTGADKNSRAVWGNRAIWGTNTLSSSRAVWGSTFWLNLDILNIAQVLALPILKTER